MTGKHFFLEICFPPEGQPGFERSSPRMLREEGRGIPEGGQGGLWK